MSQSLAVTLAASAAMVASGNGSDVDIGALRRAMKMTVRVTTYTEVDLDPTPSVLLTIQTRATSSLPWRTVDTLSVTATGLYELYAAALDQLVRVTWTLTNMTTVTFEALGEAHVVYCDPADLTVPAAALEGDEPVTASKQAQTCIDISDVVDGYLNSAYELPLTAWDRSLRLKSAELYTAKLFRDRGCDPSGADKVVFDAESLALKWFDRLADGKIRPPGIIDTAPTVYEGGSYVVSQTSRGW